MLTEKAGQQYYHHRGTANSVFQVSDAAGKIVNAYDYDAFGAPVSTHETVENTAKFGAREETTPGTYYFRERLYSSRTGRFLSVDPIRAADANRSFRVGSLPANANPESNSTIYQKRLSVSGHEYTGQPVLAQSLASEANTVASSPLFEQRLIASTMGLDVTGYTYVGNNPANHTDPTGEAILWNPLSFSILSGCFISKCIGSVCIGSTCVSTACTLSICVSTSHTCGSICVSSGCYFDSGCVGGSSC